VGLVHLRAEENVRNDGRKLALFVAGNSSHSQAAIANLNRALVALDREQGDVEIIDVFERPDRAEAARVLVTPTLLWEADTDLRMIGDLSAGDRLMAFVR
jgi:circadian clock protein KaiB